MSFVTAYARTSLTVAIIVIAGAFALSDLRLASWEALEAVFAWSETTVFGYIGKTWGAAFATVEALHHWKTFRISKGQIAPFVTIIIPAYNEAKHIEKKIENTLALKYPKDKLEILVASDGSTDNTPALAEKYSCQGIQLVDFETNRGKTTVQNDLAKKAKGEILIFTDAASFLHAHAIEKIVQNFTDNRVGCVAGRMHFANTDFNIKT